MGVRYGVIALAVMLGVIVCAALGYSYMKYRDEKRQREEEAASRQNIDDALEIVREIDEVRAVQRELKATFARRELEGGAKAALSHPLYLQAQTRLDELHEALTILI